MMTNILELDSYIKLARSALSSVKFEMLAAQHIQRGGVSLQHLPHDIQQALPLFWSGHKAALQEMSSVRTCTRLISSKSS